MTRAGSDDDSMARDASLPADGLAGEDFERLGAAAAALLDPLLTDDAPAGAWRARMARAMEALGAAARALELGGLAYLAGLLVPHLARAPIGDPALERRQAEAWVDSAIAFCGAALPVSEHARWLAGLREWLGLKGRGPDEVFEAIAGQLEVDAARLQAAAETDMPKGSRGGASIPIDVAADELVLLAEACDDIGEELGEVDDDGPDGRRDRLEQYAERLGHFANAVGYIGLNDLAALIQVSAETVASAAGRDEAPASLLAGLREWPMAWAAYFRAPDRAHLDAALSVHERAGLGSASLIEVVRQAAGMLSVSGATRRVTLPQIDPARVDLSLELAADAEPELTETLLREMPALAETLGRAIEAIVRGDTDAIEPAQRAAHTLKGAANTAGVRGVAELTHSLEGVLELAGDTGVLAEHSDGRRAAISDSLAEAADVIADMVDALVSHEEGPAGARAALAGLIGWTRHLLGDAPPPAAVASSMANVASIAAAEPSEPSGTPGGPAPSTEADDNDAEEFLRIPVRLLEQLVEQATDASITLARAQEALRQSSDSTRALIHGGDRLLDLASELDRLVDTGPGAESIEPVAEGMDALEMDRYSELHTTSRRIAEAGADDKLLASRLRAGLGQLRDAIERVERAHTEIRELALLARLVPVASIGARLRRVARQAARMAQKEVSLAISGEETLFENRLLQRLVEPIAHLIRNAVDHGIEPPAQRRAAGKPDVGRVQVSFQREGPTLVVSCVDDGAGFDRAAILARALRDGLLAEDVPPDTVELGRLLTRAGFSTRDQATMLSGRGIGLDAVDQVVRSMHGSLEIDDAPDGGARLTLRVPLRVASMAVMVARTRTHVLAIGVRGIERIAALEEGLADVRQAPGACPVLYLGTLLGLPADALRDDDSDSPQTDREESVLFCRDEAGKAFAIVCPPLSQAQQVIVRPPPAILPAITGLDGIAVLPDGAVAPVYAPDMLLRGSRDSDPRYAREQPVSMPTHCLVVDDSVSVRRAMETLLADMGFGVDTAADGIEALARIEKRVPAIVLVDLEMPRMNGIELTRALRARDDTRGLPIIMITSRSTERHRALADEAGVTAFLNKPYRDDELLETIASCLDRMDR
ncbi:MAG: response regulator [Burkholderiaceae bacterium]|nr:response regulator [Burkholderiaceae bacterium]